MVENKDFILTGKAKEAFNKWNYDNDFGYIDHEPTSLVVHFEDLDENLRNTIIIDWFDSVNIHLSVSYDMPLYRYNILGIDPFYCTDLFDSRHEATAKAIERANEIFNNR